jgi:hypothetical protein
MNFKQQRRPRKPAGKSKEYLNGKRSVRVFKKQKRTEWIIIWDNLNVAYQNGRTLNFCMGVKYDTSFHVDYCFYNRIISSALGINPGRGGSDSGCRCF